MSSLVEARHFKVEHTVAGCIVANTSWTRFLVQQKCEEHPVVACRGGFSLWGGGAEDGESSLETLQREIEEEWVACHELGSWREFVKRYAIDFSTQRIFSTEYGASEMGSFYLLLLPDRIFDILSKHLSEPSNVIEGRSKELHLEHISMLARSPRGFLFGVGNLIHSLLEYVRASMSR